LISGGVIGTITYDGKDILISATSSSDRSILADIGSQEVIPAKWVSADSCARRIG
jgi:hypothetical protein